MGGVPCGSSTAQFSRGWVLKPGSVTVTAMDAVLTGGGVEVGDRRPGFISSSQKTDWCGMFL